MRAIIWGALATLLLAAPAAAEPARLTVLDDTGRQELAVLACAKGTCTGQGRLPVQGQMVAASYSAQLTPAGVMFQPVRIDRDDCWITPGSGAQAFAPGITMAVVVGVGPAPDGSYRRIPVGAVAVRY